MAQSLPRPVAVFLDTNILDSLPETLESGELSALVARAARVLVTDITVREWLTHRFRRVRDAMANARAAEKYLSQYFATWVKTELPQENKISRIVLDSAIKQLRRAEVRITPPPRIDERDIRYRSLMKIPPFGDQGRGFKDELVLLGILKFLSKWDYKSAILLTKDKDFVDAIRSRFDDIGVKFIIVREFSEAQKLIDEDLDKTEKETIASMKVEAQKIANSHWVEIKAIIESRAANEGLSAYFALISYTKNDLPEGSSMRKLVSVIPLGIDHVTVGQTHSATGRTLITISVECEIVLEVEQADPMASVFLTKMVVGKPVQWHVPRPVEKTLTLKRSILVEATARHKDGTWADFQIIDDSELFRLTSEINEADGAA
jgi:PIN domain